MKVTIKGWVHAIPPFAWEAKGSPCRFVLFSGRLSNGEHYIPICEVETQVEIPDGWSLEAGQITQLIAAKAEALVKYRERVNEINERLAKLQALPNDPSATVVPERGMEP